MKRSTVAVVALGLGLTLGGLPTGGVFEGLSPIGEAHAIVGRPLTPVSYAGVARRTTRRVIYRSTVYVATLPPACTIVVVEGTTLHMCSGTYYQPYGTQYVVVTVK